MGFNPGLREQTTEDSVEVSLDGVTLAPTVYESEASGTAEMATYTDQCGYSEAEKQGPGTMTLTFQAILYKPYVKEIHRVYEEGTLIEVTHPAEIGTFDLQMQDFTINQTGDHHDFVGPDGQEREVFDVQIQLKSPQVENEGQ